MIRLLLLIPTLDRSGAEKQLAELAAGLPRDRFDVHVAVLDRAGPYAESLAEAGIPVTRLGKRWKLDPRALLRLKRLLSTLKPDVLHTWLFAANAYGRLAVGSNRTTRVIVSERCVDSWKSSWQKWLDRRLVPRTDRLLANSRSVSSFYLELGIPEGLIEVIPNGIDVEAIASRAAAGDAGRAAVRDELGLPPDARLVTCVGRLARQKRVRDLVWAIELLHRIDSRTWLICVGDGPQREWLERHARRIGCPERVRFTGHRDDVPRLWAASDVAWLASDFEGQSNSLMEAMATGLPVVATDIAPNRELVTDGQTGRLVPVGDSAAFARVTAELLDDSQHAETIGNAARQAMADRFSLEAMIESHVRLYTSLVE